MPVTKNTNIQKKEVKMATLNDEMKELVKEYGVIKVDAVNCIDCLLGGKGKYFEADPTHELLLLDPGYIGIFKYWKKNC
jgi:hypothetical protein